MHAICSSCIRKTQFAQLISGNFEISSREQVILMSFTLGCAGWKRSLQSLWMLLCRVKHPIKPFRNKYLFQVNILLSVFNTYNSLASRNVWLDWSNSDTKIIKTVCHTDFGQIKIYANATATANPIASSGTNTITPFYIVSISINAKINEIFQKIYFHILYRRISTIQRLQHQGGFTVKYLKYPLKFHPENCLKLTTL